MSTSIIVPVIVGTISLIFIVYVYYAIKSYYRRYNKEYIYGYDTGYENRQKKMEEPSIFKYDICNKGYQDGYNKGYENLQYDIYARELA